MTKIIQLQKKEEKFYPKIRNDYILLNLNESQDVNTTSNTKINFNNIIDSHGTGLSLSNGGVKIGKGISKIRADLTLWIEAYNSYSAYFLYKNSSNLTYNIFPKFSTGETWRTGNSFAYTSVKEGDIIYGYVKFSSANANNKVNGNYQNSCVLGVQVIE